MIAELGYRGELEDRRRLSERLAQTGLSAQAAAAKAEMFARAAEAVDAERLRSAASVRQAFYVPGRIEVLGKHTDYAGGRTMVAAAERGFVSVAAPARGRTVRVIDVGRNEVAEFEIGPDLVPPVGHWSNYPMTVARRLARNFPGMEKGATIALASDLPQAAGMSSSSALMVTIFLALDEVNQIRACEAFRANVPDTTALAGYLGTIENGQTFGTLEGDRGVGTFGGSEDHTAMLCARPGEISQYQYCPVVFERSVPLPAGYTFAVGSSGVAAEKTGAAMAQYNRASRLVAALLETWHRGTGHAHQHLARALAAEPNAARRLRELVERRPAGEFSPGDLLTRLEHFRVENDEVVPGAGDALSRGDLGRFADWVERSQQAAEDLLGNQVAQTAALAADARGAGAVCASAFGAGFGGSVWALVETAVAERFLDRWADGYRRRFPENAARAEFFATGAGPSACRVF